MRWSAYHSANLLFLCAPMALVMTTSALTGCGEEREPVNAGDGVPIPVDGSSTGEVDDGDAPDSGVDKLDVAGGGEGQAGDDGGASGCQKVDFLFVIDSSGSMEDEQTNLINSFPGFISTIQSTLMAEDYHIMVVDTGLAPIADVCNEVCQFLSECNGIPCDEIEAPGGCNSTRGAGRIRSAEGQACNIQGDQRYLRDGQPNLEDTFACIARVGTNGNGDEQQSEAMLDAVSSALNEGGGCNEGFLRDDAVLVVTMITDEEDGASGPDANGETPSPGDPDDWYDTLVGLKGDNPNNVVTLGLVGDTGNADGICTDIDPQFGTGAEASPRLRAFVELFPNAVLGSVCAPDYSPFFMEAVSVIDTACDQFDPVG